MTVAEVCNPPILHQNQRHSGESSPAGPQQHQYHNICTASPTSTTTYGCTITNNNSSPRQHLSPPRLDPVSVWQVVRASRVFTHSSSSPSNNKYRQYDDDSFKDSIHNIQYSKSLSINHINTTTNTLVQPQPISPPINRQQRTFGIVQGADATTTTINQIGTFSGYEPVCFKSLHYSSGVGGYNKNFNTIKSRLELPLSGAVSLRMRSSKQQRPQAAYPSCWM